MPGIIRPVGREPASVYWMRRGIAVGCVVLVVVAGYWVGHRLHRHHVPHPAASPSASPSTTPRPTASSTVKRCADSSMAITASTNASTYAPGADIVMQLHLTNTSSTSCVRDIGASVNSFTITSGGYPTWSSTDCSPPSGHKLVTISGKHSVVVTEIWKRQRSMKGCPTLSGSAGAGFYELVVGNGALLSNPAKFSLS